MAKPPNKKPERGAVPPRAATKRAFGPCATPSIRSSASPPGYRAAMPSKKVAELQAQMARCLERQTPPTVNLSLPKHSIITSALRSLVFDQRFSGRDMPVVFMDGSIPHPFPVGRLIDEHEPTPLSEAEVIRVGLMSFRHPDLDYLVDLYVIRNAELARQASMADAERLSHDRTVDLLSDPAVRDGAEVWVYHTGLEPMVVGFYRGVVDVLERRRIDRRPRQLVIRPWFFSPDKAEISEPPYTRESPGANHANYRPQCPWW